MRHNKAHFYPIFARLHKFLPRQQIAALIGVDWNEHFKGKMDIPVCRLGYLVARLLENPREPIHLFDILTLGAYEMTAEQKAVLRGKTPQEENVRPFSDTPTNRHCGVEEDYSI